MEQRPTGMGLGSIACLNDTHSINFKALASVRRVNLQIPLTLKPHKM